MRTTKTYRLPPYALKALERLKTNNPNWISDSDIISYSLALSSAIMDAWNSNYEDKTPDVYEKFDIEDDKIATDILKILYRELGHKNH